MPSACGERYRRKDLISQRPRIALNAVRAFKLDETGKNSFMGVGKSEWP